VVKDWTPAFAGVTAESGVTAEGGANRRLKEVSRGLPLGENVTVIPTQASAIVRRKPH